MDSVVIVSGGMDSVTLLQFLVKREKRDPAVMTFQYGQKHSREIDCAKAQVALLGIKAHMVVDLRATQAIFGTSALVSEDISIPNIQDVVGDNQPATYVPNRNMLFLAYAVAYAESLKVNRVFYGAQAHDLYGYWDTTPEFLARLNDVYSLNRKDAVRIEAPFVQYSKADVLRTGVSLEVDYAQTWSCYAGQDKACGKCPTCAERLKAFEEVGLVDPISYAVS
ncbi:MAG: 7-cyano-7-deazaguanine synthase QueC [Anaerolineae bacterium]|nr:7-cyano-7-deazaguanine synthase QueC [Anaerolineae bacterium]